MSAFARGVVFFRSSIQKYFWLRLFLTYIFFFSVFSSYFFIDNFISLDDQFFNIRLAQQLSQHGFSVLTEFNEFAFSHGHPWIYNTLFYFLLIPFTWFHPLELGIKVFAVTTLAATCTMVYTFLSMFSFQRAFFWTTTLLVAFFAVEDFGHFLMARAFVVAPALLLLLLILLAKKKYLLAGALTFLYLFLHTATSFFPLVLGAVYAVFVAKRDRHEATRSFVAILSGFSIALLCGILFLPGFWQAIMTFFVTLQEIVLSFHGAVGQVKIDEGMESYPTTLFDIFLRRPFFGLILITLIVVESVRLLRSVHQGKQPDAPVFQTLFFMTLLFLLGSFVTKRALDFFLPFGLLFTAFALKERIEELRIGEKRLYSIGLSVALVVAGSAHMLNLADAVASSRHYSHIEGAAVWLRDNTEEDSIVFNPTINFFPTFYFYNGGHNRVIIGIEPRDMYKKNPEKYWLWYHLSNYGIVCEKQLCAKEQALKEASLQENEEEWYRSTGIRVAHLLREEFQTDTILVRSDFTSLSNLLEKSGSYEQVYVTPLTKLYSVYRIKE